MSGRIAVGGGSLGYAGGEAQPALARIITEDRNIITFSIE
jgi:hypothetical protein